MAKVFIPPAQLVGLEASYYHLFREAGFDLVYQKRGRQLVEDEILTDLQGCCACIAGSEPYTPRVLAANPQLRCIARAGVGYDAVDLPAATKQGIAVCFAPGTNHDAVAEHTFALILALAKNLSGSTTARLLISGPGGRTCRCAPDARNRRAGPNWQGSGDSRGSVRHETTGV